MLEDARFTLARRRFLELSGKSLALTAVAGKLAACGGGGGGGKSHHDNRQEQVGGTEQSLLPAVSAEFHFLSRTSYGVKPDQLALINSIGIDAYLEQQLNYTAFNTLTLSSYIATHFPTSVASPETLLASFPDNAGTVVQQMASATQYRQYFSPCQLYEVMVEFWSNHFNIQLANGLGPTLKPQDDKNIIRENALGKFRHLLNAVARSPAMLFYLDNYLNVAGGPNENYARELMELHTLGVDGGYTEADVKEVARCFTGWTIYFPGQGGTYGTFRYDSTVHDDGSKQVLGLSVDAGGGQTDGSKE